MKKLVLIDWIDPWSKGGWIFKDELAEIAKRNLGCQTVGWIIRENKDRIILVSSIQSDKGEQVGDLFILPKACIKSITPLEPVPQPT